MKKSLRGVVGLAIGIALLWLVFRNTEWREVWLATRGASAGLLGVAAVLVMATFFTRVKC